MYRHLPSFQSFFLSCLLPSLLINFLPASCLQPSFFYSLLQVFVFSFIHFFHAWGIFCILPLLLFWLYFFLFYRFVCLFFTESTYSSSFPSSFFPPFLFTLSLIFSLPYLLHFNSDRCGVPSDLGRLCRLEGDLCRNPDSSWLHRLSPDPLLAAYLLQIHCESPVRLVETCSCQSYFWLVSQ